MNNKNQDQPPISPLQQTQADLQRQADALRANPEPGEQAIREGINDTARLDWLEVNAFQRVDEDTCRQSVHVGLLGKTFENGRSLREAIDAAMEGQSVSDGGRFYGKGYCIGLR